MVARSVCDCCPARAIMENMDWFIDMVLFFLGAVTSSSASSPSLKRSGTSSDSLRGSFSESRRFLEALRLDLALSRPCDAMMDVWARPSYGMVTVAGTRRWRRRSAAAAPIEEACTCRYSIFIAKVGQDAHCYRQLLGVTYCSIHGTDTPTHDGSCTHDVKRQRATCPDHLPGIITQQVSCSNTAPLGLILDTHPHVIFKISDTH